MKDYRIILKKARRILKLRTIAAQNNTNLVNEINPKNQGTVGIKELTMRIMNPYGEVVQNSNNSSASKLDSKNAIMEFHFNSNKLNNSVKPTNYYIPLAIWNNLSMLKINTESDIVKQQSIMELMHLLRFEIVKMLMVTKQLGEIDGKPNPSKTN